MGSIMKAKYVSLAILMFLVLIGVVALFAGYDMKNYEILAKSVATVLVPLFISIGSNSIVDKIKGKDSKDEDK